MKKNKTNMFIPFTYCLLCVLVCIGYIPLPSLAQEGSPLPGNNFNPANISAQSSTNNFTNNQAAPIPGNGFSNYSPENAAISESSLQAKTVSASTVTIPITLSDWHTLIQELKSGNASEDDLNKYLWGIDTIIRAHNKLATAFSKLDVSSTVNNERSLLKQFCLLKNELLYLKAKILIEQNKLCEAAGILADITAFEPNSALGRKSYKQLVEIGFSPKPSADPLESKTTINNTQASSTKAIRPTLQKQLGVLPR